MGCYINIETQYEVCTNNAQIKGGVRTNDQPDTLPVKGLKGQKTEMKMNETRRIGFLLKTSSLIY